MKLTLHLNIASKLFVFTLLQLTSLFDGFVNGTLTDIGMLHQIGQFSAIGIVFESKSYEYKVNAALCTHLAFSYSLIVNFVSSIV